MRYYFAPLEGITDCAYRRLHAKYFPGVDRYYTPFFSPTVHRTLTPREIRELPPAEGMAVPVVPQLLTKVPEDLIWMAQQCRDLGYEEVNLNLGCPSGTVTAKGKGAGMLQEPSALDQFLDRVFSGCPLPISVKTRLGFSDPAEFPAILEIYNRYPIRELTVHPRVRRAFYKGCIDRDAFRYAAENSRSPLCFNGDIVSRAQAEATAQSFPNVRAVMIGRALIADPGMLTPGGTTPDTLEAFLGELTEEYARSFGSARNTMFRMKEHWSFLIHKFDGSERLAKQLRKTTDLSEFNGLTRQIIRTLPMRATPVPLWLTP